jgi:hypothetical protein
VVAFDRVGEEGRVPKQLVDFRANSLGGAGDSFLIAFAKVREVQR